MKEPTVDSGSSSLKRKHPPTKDREPPPMKKAKKSKLEGDAVQTIENHKQLHKKKGKGKEKGHSSGIEFKNINARMSVTIPPLYSGPGRPHQAVLEMLDGMLMQYVIFPSCRPNLIDSNLAMFRVFKEYYWHTLIWSFYQTQLYLLSTLPSQKLILPSRHWYGVRLLVQSSVRGLFSIFIHELNLNHRGYN